MMPDASIGPLLGGLVGLASALAGVWLADFLRRRHEHELARQATELDALDAAVANLKLIIWAALREAILPRPWPNLATLRLGQELLHADLDAIPDEPAVAEVLETCTRLLWRRRFGWTPLLHWFSKDGLAERQALSTRLIAAAERIEAAARQRRKALAAGRWRRTTRGWKSILPAGNRASVHGATSDRKEVR